MTTPRPAAPWLGGSPDEVEARFYEALQNGDLEALMAVWAEDEEIVCVHPGGGRVVGVAAIRASFAALFARGGVPVQPTQVRRLAWVGGALHHLAERIDIRHAEGVQTAWVLATNVYVKSAQGWRMVAHHASPGEPGAPPAGDDAPSTLH
jgi:uncharacterized protein (TIGR02246 family)